MITIVVPTLGRPSLRVLLNALAAHLGEAPDLEILLVNDRPGGGPALPVPSALSGYATVVNGAGTGPAAARNVGWRAARHPWVAFLDDDVVPDPDWLPTLLTDLAVANRVGGVQGRIRVPLPAHRRPTDWERVTAGLAAGRWITADMAYRRAALAAVDGFDERFPRAYREDADLAHRIQRAGWRLTVGQRSVRHPVRPEGPWISLRTQRGNADDALLRRRYGPRWRTEMGLPPGRRGRHVTVTAAGTAALLAAGLRATAARGPAADRLLRLAVVAGLAWAAGTAEFAAARIGPGPRTPTEIATMLATSALIPPLAVGHWLAGWWRARRVAPTADGRR